MQDQDGLILHTPPTAGELPERLQALCAFANDRSDSPFIHPVARAFRFVAPEDLDQRLKG